MRVSITSEYRFIATPDGAVWTDGPCHYAVWARLLQVFDSVNVLARVSRAEQPAGTWRRADGPGVGVSALPFYLGPWQYLRRVRHVTRAIAAAISPDDAIILNVPGQIGNCAAAVLPPDRPYAVQVQGDPYDVFAPGAVRHPLRPLLRIYLTRRLTTLVRRASAALYVTERSLQKRYPCAGPTVGVSDVDLTDEALSAGPRTALVTPGVLRLVSVGSMSQPYKGFDVLIAALAQTRVDGLDLRLSLVGDGAYRAELERLAARLGVADRVDFLGQLAAGPQVRAALDAADLYVLPSRTEGLPRALVEAMARGLPCLASRVGGVPELLARDDLVAAGDVAALSEAIAGVAADPKRRARMAARNLTRARDYHGTSLGRRRTEFFRLVGDLTAARHRAGDFGPAIRGGTSDVAQAGVAPSGVGSSGVGAAAAQEAGR
jgi:glycosyltransferase involved in cell wall biosynthesis